jgi:hypothetical protein
VLNDDVLIDNIETNILKNIADNEARPELSRLEIQRALSSRQALAKLLMSSREGSGKILFL